MPWGHDAQTAIAEAKRSGRLTVVDFYADWCGYCKQFDRETFRDPGVVRLLKPFVVVKLNGEKEGAALARRYGVRTYPVILFLTPDGEPAGRVRRFMPPREFEASVRRIAQAHRDRPRLEARLRTRPDDVGALAGLATVYAIRGQLERARSLMTQAEQADRGNQTGLLTKAYNSVGAAYRLEARYDDAIPLFRSAAETGKDPAGIAYARLSLALCYLSKNQRQPAETELVSLLTHSGAPESYRSEAERLLAELRRTGR